MKEEDLYEPVKAFLEAEGFAVYGEVHHCDVTAVREDNLTIVELKRNLSVELLVQGVLRQKLTPNVYIAVPKFKRMKKYDEWKHILYLLRRLELGLLLVDVERGIVEMAAEPRAFDLEKSRARSKDRVAALIKECASRSTDLNKGGSQGKKLVTGYREQAIYIACILKRYGAQYPKEIRLKGGNPKKTLGILKNNYYHWFECLSDGKYALNDLGILELEEYGILTEQFYRQIAQQNKILYITELDGTLLNSAGRLSEFTRIKLKSLLEAKVSITVATNRSFPEVQRILGDLELPVPMILLHGALIYDTSRKDYLQVHYLPETKVMEIQKVLKQEDQGFFLHVAEEGQVLTCHTGLKSPAEIDFLMGNMGNTYPEGAALTNLKQYRKQVICVTIIGEYTALWNIQKQLLLIKGISPVLYPGLEASVWRLDVFSSKAGKAAGLQAVKETAGARHTIAFGSNVYTMELMQAAEESYAAANASEAILKAASGVILSNDEDGVVKFIDANEML